MGEGHLARELDKIKKRLFTLGETVEERLQTAVSALQTDNPEAAQSILDTDHEVDEMEVAIEEECLKALALYQPVAVDLRMITAIVKINNDLERIADLAKSVCRRYRSAKKAAEGSLARHYDYTAMGETVCKMLEMSMQAIGSLDTDTAKRVIGMDAAVNTMRDNARDYMETAVREDPADIDETIHMYLVSRHLERAADHITNIAEEVVYLAEGEIIRHQDKRGQKPWR